MEEFLAEGTATSYRLSAGTEATDDGHWDTAPDSLAPYRTCLYVVRPCDPASFNGVVLVNWQNVTAGVDLGAPYDADLRRGLAWVGVTIQHVATDGQAAIAAGLGATTGLPVWDPNGTAPSPTPVTPSPRTSSPRRRGRFWPIEAAYPTRWAGWCRDWSSARRIPVGHAPRLIPQHRPSA